MIGENTPMRVITLNANGIRSASDKGMFEWLAQTAPDVVCVQELKAQQADLDERHLRVNSHPPLNGIFSCAHKKGYSGVGLYLAQTPQRVSEGFGVSEFDQEGRLIRADLEGLTVMSLYAPSGSASEERQASKFRFMEAFLPRLEGWMREHQETGREFLICGDWNIAHTERDLKNWKGNLKNSGFLPEERAWIGDILNRLGWVDVYRRLLPDASDESYTWWSQRGQAYAKNVGWRIDYQIATPGLAQRARSARVFKERRFSDHAPLIIDFDQ